MSQFIWPASFACTLVNEKIILPTTYNISVSIAPEYKGRPDVNIGLRKLKAFIDIRLQNSIFVFNDNPLVKTLDGVVNNAVMFPSEPYDYFVGCVLFRKFLVITQNYLDIEFISIDSLVGGHVQYSIEDPEESGLDLDGNFWWNLDTLYTGSLNDVKWDDLNIDTGPKFEPKIVRGGLSENK